MCNISLLPLITIKTKADMGSDHLPIEYTLALKTDKTVRGKRRKWIFDDTKWMNFKTKMSETILMPGTLIEEANQFSQDIRNIGKEEFKQSSNKVTLKFNKPWWNQECSKKVAIRRRARRRMERSGSRLMIIAYKKQMRSH